jgi:hypothetical protein
LIFSSYLQLYYSYPTAREKGYCKRYSLDQEISIAVQETPESVELNIPRLLIAKNSSALFGFEARIVIIVSLDSGRSFETTLKFSLSADLLYTKDSAF